VFTCLVNYQGAIKMTDRVDIERIKRDPAQQKALIIGTVVGALIGAGAAYLLIQNAEREGRSVSISAGDGVKLGVTLMALLRQVAALGE
jgi:hypothetical protein